MSRMCILNKQEQVAFDLPPKFDSTQRKRFFDFSKTLLFNMLGEYDFAEEKLQDQLGILHLKSIA